MDKRYVSLSVVCGKVVKDEVVPLEVAILILDSAMRPIDNYSTPVIPSSIYDLSMVSMHTSAHLTNALDDEGLWSQMTVNSHPVEIADRYVSDKIERHCRGDEHQVVVLCDNLVPTQDAVYRFLPAAAKKLDRLNSTWLEIEPIKAFVEGERIYGVMPWKYRAAERARAVANYAYQMRKTLVAGARDATRPVDV